MRILHVLSQFEVTGAEVYAAVLARRQHEQGNTVFIVSDTFSVPFPGTYIPHPIGVRNYRQRFRSIKFLVQLIRRERISAIHAHSRAASWVSYFASLITKIPLVSTIHGRQHLHLSLRLFNVYGRHIIAVNKSLKEHLTNDLRMSPEWVLEIPNGVGIPSQPTQELTLAEGRVPGKPPREPVLLFVGRLTGPKGDLVRSLITEVMPRLLRTISCSLQIVGGQIIPAESPELVKSANQSTGKETVVLRGFQQNVRPFFDSADLFIGSGRAAVEALLSGTPALGFGESGYIGQITPSTVDAAAESNFGDTGVAQPYDQGVIVEDILRTLREGQDSIDRTELRSFVETHFDIKTVERRVASVYERARAPLVQRKKIPVLMYHRVVEDPPLGSRHGIWVTARQFESQLRSLKERGFSAITLREYRSCMRGDASWPRKPILLTFDDGYEDNYTVAFPLLQRYNCSAVVFLVADFSQRTNFWDNDEPVAPLLSCRQIQEMERGGVEFGSHTLTHPHLSRVSSKEVFEEMASSKKAVEDLTGREVLSMAYPYGDVNGDVKTILKETGYGFGVATDSGPLSLPEDLSEIRRIQVFPGTDRFGFWRKTNPWYPRYRSALGK